MLHRLRGQKCWEVFLTGVDESREDRFIPLLSRFHEDTQRSFRAQHGQQIYRRAIKAVIISSLALRPFVVLPYFTVSINNPDDPNKLIFSDWP